MSGIFFKNFKRVYLWHDSRRGALNEASVTVDLEWKRFYDVEVMSNLNYSNHIKL